MRKIEGDRGKRSVRVDERRGVGKSMVARNLVYCEVGACGGTEELEEVLASTTGATEVVAA